MNENENENENEKIAGDFVKVLGWFNGHLIWSDDHNEFILRSASGPPSAPEHYNELFRMYKAGLKARK